ncbi:HD-GYP domain-containing protein [Marinitoga litoralis]|uniref:HD-GYP domain-containing protein n=1 Tax=Marinitoga litoralis TaxID=570855 RepID=UPI00195F6F09|nr:HD-GYP domain-containing protein [Marinitoga litoralis]MBM7558588.1 polar amino acid transport system substrate-binding protein [Marinitoga litoralis]
MDKSYEELLALKTELEEAYEQLEVSYSELEELNNRFIRVTDLITNISMDISMESFFGKLLSYFVELIPEISSGCVLNREGDFFRFVSVLGHNKKLLLDTVILNEEFHEIVEIENFYSDYIKNFDVIKDNIIMSNKSLIIPLETFELHGYIILDLKDRIIKNLEKDLIKVMSKIASTYLMSKTLYTEQQKFLKNTAFAFLKAVDFYDPYTKGHSERVSYYATSLAKIIGKDDIINDIFIASALHDIGKLSIPQSILLKKERLTNEEFDKIKEHPVRGEELVKTFKGFEKIGKIIRHHHERCDGKGYPDGLTCDKIPLESRIITIVDAFDAMTTVRSYRDALSVNTAIKELIKNKGKQFDPELTDEFIKFLKINKFFEEE